MTTIISRSVAVKNLGELERQTLLNTRDANRVSYEHIRYEYNWDGYTCWCGGLLKAHTFIDAQNTEYDESRYVSNDHFDQIGQLLACS